MRFLVFVFIVLLIGGCGYKPSAKYSREVVGEKISTSVDISATDPQNTVIIKDAVDSAIVEVFHASLVPKSESQTHLKLSISNPSYTPIQYDENGYIIAYRTTLTLHITKYRNGFSKNYTAKGSYDFAIEPQATISDQKRFEAIRNSSIKAIRSFLAKISSEGARGDR